MSNPFARFTAMMALIAAGLPHGNYKSRGHGEGLSRNKHARSSFKQNKRRGM